MKNAPLPSTRQPDIWAAALLILAACAMLSAQTPAAATRAGAGIGGFKIGDTVKINTAFGWIDAKVLKVNGNSYYVHAQNRATQRGGSGAWALPASRQSAGQYRGPLDGC